MNYYYNDNRGSLGSFLRSATGNLILINLFVFVMTLVNEELMIKNFALFFPNMYVTGYENCFRWWQPITHMFMHGGWMHIFFNMYTLYIFGSVLERIWGAKKFLIFYFVTGLGAAALHMGVQFLQVELLMRGEITESIGKILQICWTPTVGASGAIYGLLMGYAMLFPDSVLTLIFPPISLKAKWFVVIFAAIELLLGTFGAATDVAHFAHLGGMLFGFILILFWKKKQKMYTNY